MCGNFSNVLSINLYKGIQTNKINEYDQNVWEFEDKNLNYDLTTGNKLEFEDLFTNTASIKNIISQSAYTSLANKYLDGEYIDEDTLETDMDTVRNSNLEEEAFRIVNNYISGKNIDFNFSTNYIYLTIEDSSIQIKMADFYESIAIYNRFISETEIFENKPTKELYVFLNRYYNYIDTPYYVKVEEIKEGVFIDITLEGCENEDINRVYDLYISQLNNEIENYKEEINKDPNKAMIISSYIYSSQEENGINIHTSRYINYMPMDYYKENMFSKIIDQAQYPYEGGSVEISYYDENFYENSEYVSETRIYDLEENVYYITESITVQNGNTWTTVDEIIKTYDATTGKLIKEESLAENERSHAIMNNMYVQ